MKDFINEFELFKNTNGEVVINSLKIAELLGRKHNKVLRDIREFKIIGDCPLNGQSYKNSQNKEQPYYELNKYQFMKYAMRIKGFEELKNKVIDDYETMEKFIQESKLTEEFKYYRETGKVARRDLTNTVKEVIKPSNNFVYRNYTELAYKLAFNKDTKQLKAELNLGKKDNLRDNLSSDMLKEILLAEEKIKGMITTFEIMGIEEKEIYHKIKEIILK